MKKYKKGTKIKLWSSCNFVGCKSEQVVTLDSDYTKEELEVWAEEFMNESLVPEFGFKVVTTKDSE